MYELVSGHPMTLWSEQALRRNLTRMHNAELEDFLQDKCPQYSQLTDSFVRRFKYNCTRNSPSVLFDIYDTSYTMDLEDFTTACKLPQWGNTNDPHKSDLEISLLVLLWENPGT